MLKLFNTMSREKEPLEPLDGKIVKMYACGPTVYNYAHIGNLRTYIFEDILRRTILYNGLKIQHVVNITDVGHLTSDADEGEDKMEKGAQREGKTVWEIAEEYTEAFKKDIEELNIQEPEVWCRATEHIKEQIWQVKALEKNGFTYKTDDGIYFDTTKIDDYGKLTKLKLEQLKAGHRVVVGEKKNHTDFAIWKFSPKTKQRAMEWIFQGDRAGTLVTDKLRPTLTAEELETLGFPGWHIECSAMSMKYLGDQFDIHCGGIDHIQVHHTNEIAQAEGATGKKPWVKHWLHSEFLVMDKGRMAKSEGNFITLATLKAHGFDPVVYRYMCLTAHYRQQLTFSWEALETAKHGLDSIKTKLLDLKENEIDKEDDDELVEKHNTAFLTAINDDLNMPQALAVLWAVLRDENLSSDKRVELADKFDDVLGLKLSEVGNEKIPLEIAELAQNREKYRAEKNWKKSDELRDIIKSKGYIVDDTKNGYKVRKA